VAGELEFRSLEKKHKRSIKEHALSCKMEEKLKKRKFKPGGDDLRKRIENFPG